MRITSNKAVTALGVLTVALAICSNAQAQPFKVKGGGSVPEGLSVLGLESPYNATGTATRLGRYSGVGFAQVTGPGTFTGEFLFVAANGDMLLCEHPGTFEVIPDGDRMFAIFDATFTPVGGTGRFADVGGSFRMIAVTELFDFVVNDDNDPISTTAFDFEWTGNGQLEF